MFVLSYTAVQKKMLRAYVIVIIRRYPCYTSDDFLFAAFLGEGSGLGG